MRLLVQAQRLLFVSLANACVSASEPLPEPVAIEPRDGGESPSVDAAPRGCPPEIVTAPPDQLLFRRAPNVFEQELTVFNNGCEDLVIESATIIGPEGLRDHPSVDDFVFDSCSDRPCPPICGSAEASCATHALTFTIRYAPNDLSSTDLADFRLRTNDPVRPEVILVLIAE
jgi:hypothetical protein